MTSAAELTDLTDLQGLRQALSRLDPESRLSPVGIGRIEISDSAHLHVAEAVQSALSTANGPVPARVVILTDKTPIMRQGERLSALVEAQLSGRFVSRIACLDDGYDKLHADERVLAMAASQAKGSDAVITIGSGTMTDIGKIAILVVS